MLRGQCLCGAVRFEARGGARGVLVCHCVDCRRWHGHVAAMTAVDREGLVIEGESELRWFEAQSSEARARRGFCGRCGSSLFWDAPDRRTISIAAGTLAAPTGLQVIGHIHPWAAGDYYERPPEEPPRRR